MGYFALAVIALIAAGFLLSRTRFHVQQDVEPQGDDHRAREKEKALKAMSMNQHVKAMALNEGDVSELAYDGATAIVIMEDTANVYEWDGFNWIDRFPDPPLHVERESK